MAQRGWVFSCLRERPCCYHGESRRDVPVNASRGLLSSVLALLVAPCWVAVPNAHAENQIVLTRDNSTIVLEPYAPNIIRVNLSLLRDRATAVPGFGFIASPAPLGWNTTHTTEADTFHSSRLTVTVDANQPGHPTQTERDIARYFNGSAPPAHITFSTPGGKKLLELTGWSMSVPNYKDGNAGIRRDKRPSDEDF